MEKEVGRVIKIKGNEAEVMLHSRTACGHCGARFACVAGDGVDRIMTVQNHLNAKVGDQVEIELSEKTRIFSALLIFFMPLVFILVGYYLAIGIFHTEGSGIWGAVLGFIGSGFILWMVNKIAVKNQRINPQMRNNLENMQKNMASMMNSMDSTINSMDQIQKMGPAGHIEKSGKLESTEEDKMTE